MAVVVDRPTDVGGHLDEVAVVRPGEEFAAARRLDDAAQFDQRLGDGEVAVLDSDGKLLPGAYRRAVGELADPKLRSLRRQAHAYFDQLHLSGLMSKQVAYQWLSNITCTPLKRAHIGFLREYNCQLVIDESRKLLDMKHIPYPREKEARRYDTH